MQLAELDHAVRVDNEQRAVRNPGTVVKDSQALRGTAVRPEIGKQRVADSAHGCGPRFQGEHGVYAQPDDLSVGFFKLRQRTVERGGLIGSATSEGKRECV